jgi:hypothetical protein
MPVGTELIGSYAKRVKTGYSCKKNFLAITVGLFFLL